MRKISYTENWIQCQYTSNVRIQNAEMKIGFMCATIMTLMTIYRMDTSKLIL